MKKIAVAAVLVVAPLLGGSAGAAVTVAATIGGPAAHASSRTSGVAMRCHSSHGLPDRRCNSGATYATVTQANSMLTICRSGWTRKVRPPGSYTKKLKREQIGEYRCHDRRLGDYEEDHLIPLELGGSPRSVKNLWPEYDGGKIPNPKDKVEDGLRAAVCHGRIKLAPAQRAIARDWKTAEEKLGLSTPTPTPSPKPPPTPTPAPSSTGTALSCAASVSNSQPADYSTVDVYVRTAAAASSEHCGPLQDDDPRYVRHC